MIRSLLVALTICLGLSAQDARQFAQLSQSEPGCPRSDDASAGAHRQANARPMKDAATAEVIPKEARRSAAAFGVLDLEGHQQLVGEQKGKIVVVGFWSTRCDPSLKMLQEFRDFQKQASEKGMKLVIWPVHFQLWPEIQSFLRSKRQFLEGVQVQHIGIGDNGLRQVTDSLDALPTVFLIDKNGGIATSWAGYHEGLLLARINRLISER